MDVRRVDTRAMVRAAGGVAAILDVTTGLVAILERWVGVPDASATYLLAVLASAMVLGTVPAAATAFGAFLLYNFLFVHPNFTFDVADPGELLNLILLLVLGIAVGQLAAAQRSRAQAALEREREALALFRISRALATRPDTASVLPDIAHALRAEAAAERIVIGLARRSGGERVVTDTRDVAPPPSVAADHVVLRRQPGDEPATWLRVHPPAAAASAPPTDVAYRVVIEAAGTPFGSIWAVRTRQAGDPGRPLTRLMAAAADQVGQALEQDRLAREARAVEIARRSDELKTALLDSVSHDLRTPLAAIRAAAGTILEGPEAVSEADRMASAAAVDREAEHLNRLVTNLLDLSRIEGGALRADVEVVDLEATLWPMIDRFRPRLDGRDLRFEIADNLPPVRVDPVLLDQVVANLLDNTVKFVPPDAGIRIRAVTADDMVRLSVDDSGPGVPADAVQHLFEKFYRGRAGHLPSRPGTGIGLAVVRGLTEAMGGRVRARTSDMGGLGIDLELPVAGALPPEAGET